jgi:hypothetical protein
MVRSYATPSKLDGTQVRALMVKGECHATAAFDLLGLKLNLRFAFGVRGEVCEYGKPRKHV